MKGCHINWEEGSQTVKVGSNLLLVDVESFEDSPT